MIELRYNADGKLEYRIIKLGVSPVEWHEWKIVPSEQTSSYTSGIATNSYTSGVTWVHREAVDALEQELEEVKRERDELRTKLERTVIQRTTNANLHSVIRERDQEIGSLKARVAELEAAEHDSQRYEYISKEGLIETMTWAGCTDEEIAKNMIHFVPMFLDKLHKTFISVEEYEKKKTNDTTIQ